MKGLKSVHSELAKVIGAKAATGVTATAVTVTSVAGAGAVGFAGYKVVEHIKEQQEEEFISDQSIDEPADGAGSENINETPNEPDNGDSDNGKALLAQAEESNTDDAFSDDDTDSQDDSTPHNSGTGSKTTGKTSNGHKEEATNQEAAGNTPQITPAIVPQPGINLTANNNQNSKINPAVSRQNENKNSPTSGTTKSDNSSSGTGSGSSNSGSDAPEPVTPSPDVPSPINPSPDTPSPVDPTPVDPTPVEPVQPTFINGKVKGLIEPRKFDINKDVYNGLYGDSDKYDRMVTKDYTVMIYLCGTDLERDGSDASYDILKMLSQQYDMSKVNVLVCAGGTNYWNNTYMGKNDANGELYNDGCDNDDVRCNIYYLNPDAEILSKMDPEDRNKLGTGGFKRDTADNYINSDTLKLLVSLDPTDMGNTELFAGFIDFAADYFPADNYGAILWNHGGGVNTGVCFSDDNDEKEVKGTSLTADELETALASSTLGRNGQKLGFIGFDACLMGGTELAYNLSPYSEYMVGSMEYSSGGWYYGDMFKDISDQAEKKSIDNKIDNKEIAVNIAKKYYETHDSNHQDIASIACFDLSKIQDTVDKINEISDDILGLYNTVEYPNHPDLPDICYNMLKQARIHSYENGTEESLSSYQYVDQNNFFTLLKEQVDKLSDIYEQDYSYYYSLYGTDNEKAEECLNLHMKFRAISDSINDLLQNDSVLYSGAHYYGGDVFSREEGDTSINYSELWNRLKGEAIAGSSIYMPVNADYYVKTNLSDYQEMNIMKGYTGLVNKYIEQADSNKEKDRVADLAKNIDYAEIIDSQELKKSDVYKDGERLYDISYLNVKIKEKYDEDKNQENGTDQYTDPYTDLVDTLKSMNVYISNHQSLPQEDGKALQPVDMVIAKAPIEMVNISGGTNEINVVTDFLEKAMGYLVEGRIQGTESADSGIVYKKVYDWARLSDLEDDKDKKKTSLEKLKDSFNNVDKDKWDDLKWLTFKGTVYGSSDDYKNAVLYFYEKTDTDAAGQSYTYYTFAGASENNDNAGFIPTVDKTVSFDHYYIDNNEEVLLPGLYQEFVVSREINIFEKDLTSDEMIKYNNYTLGLTRNEDFKEYIISNAVKQNDEEYNKNPYLVGNEVAGSSAEPTGTENNTEEAVAAAARNTETSTEKKAEETQKNSTKDSAAEAPEQSESSIQTVESEDAAESTNEEESEDATESTNEAESEEVTVSEQTESQAANEEDSDVKESFKENTAEAGNAESEEMKEVQKEETVVTETQETHKEEVIEAETEETQTDETTETEVEDTTNKDTATQEGTTETGTDNVVTEDTTTQESTTETTSGQPQTPDSVAMEETNPTEAEPEEVTPNEESSEDNNANETEENTESQTSDETATGETESSNEVA